MSMDVGTGMEGWNSSSRRSGGALACMVNAEVCSVLAVMRRNARWAGRYMASDDQMEHPLIRSLKSLRRRVFSWQQHSWQSINPAYYLTPFLDVIRSDETGAQITGIALSAVFKIITLEVFTVKTAHVEMAMHMIVDAVTSCRFEVTDPASEEVVLMKILQVLQACMKSRAGAVLSNRDVCTVLNTTFRVVHQAGSKGELLQRTARHSMHELVRAVFSHLSTLEATTALIALPGISSDASPSNGAVYDKSASIAGNEVAGNGELPDYEGVVSPSADPAEERASRHSYSGKRDEGNSRTVVISEHTTVIEPYGIPAMVEIFSFLCSLLNIADPNSPGQALLASDEDVPHFALLLINSSIELGGESFSRHPKLLALIQDELFRNLMLMGLSPNPLVLSMVCGIVLNLYHHLRNAVKLQLEAFFFVCVDSTCIRQVWRNSSTTRSGHGGACRLLSTAIIYARDVCEL